MISTEKTKIQLIFGTRINHTVEALDLALKCGITESLCKLMRAHARLETIKPGNEPVVDRLNLTLFATYRSRIPLRSVGVSWNQGGQIGINDRPQY